MLPGWPWLHTFQATRATDSPLFAYAITGCIVAEGKYYFLYFNEMNEEPTLADTTEFVVCSIKISLRKFEVEL